MKVKPHQCESEGNRLRSLICRLRGESIDDVLVDERRATVRQSVRAQFIVRSTRVHDR